MRLAAGKPSRWLQFRLRSLVVLITLAAIGCAWVGYRRADIRRRQDVRAEVLRLRAEMTNPDSSNTWIAEPIKESVTTAPWWLALADRREVYSITEISFDRRSSDDSLPEPSIIEDEHLARLTCFAELQSLSVPRSRITDAGLKHLAALRNLQTLDLSDCNITDKGLEALGRLKSLRKLILDKTTLRGEGLAHLANCRELREISFDYATLENADALSQIESLESIKMRFCNLPSLKLSRLPNLYSLQLHFYAADDVVLEDLPALEGLRIELSTEANLKRLELRRLPKLQDLDVSLQHFVPGAAPRIALEELPELELAHFVVDGPADNLVAQIARSPKLWKLTYQSGSPTFDDASAARLKSLENLQVLDLSGSRLTDAGLESIADLRALVSLSFHSDEITDAGIARLARLEALRVLEIESRSISHQGIAPLAALRNLRVLVIAGAQGEEDLGPALAALTNVGNVNNVGHVELRRCRFPALTLAGEHLHWRRLILSDCVLPRIAVTGFPEMIDLWIEAPETTSFRIRDLPHLERLDISFASDQVVTAFEMEALPKLKWLSLQCGPRGAVVPGETFDHLHEFDSLGAGIIWGLTMPPEAQEKVNAMRKQKRLN